MEQLKNKKKKSLLKHQTCDNYSFTESTAHKLYTWSTSLSLHPPIPLRITNIPSQMYRQVAMSLYYTSAGYVLCSTHPRTHTSAARLHQHQVCLPPVYQHKPPAPKTEQSATASPWFVHTVPVISQITAAVWERVND